jgi:hypothetical protein
MAGGVGRPLGAVSGKMKIIAGGGFVQLAAISQPTTSLITGKPRPSMLTTLSYGQATQCELALDDYSFLAADEARYPAIRDIANAVREVLAHPHGYPPLAAATVPGDHVAIAIEEGVPHTASVLRGAIAALLDAGVDPALVTVVSAATIEHRDQLQQELTGIGAAGVRFERHDPDEEQATAMVGVTQSGEPLRLNRTMAEADLVLPIGVGRPPAGPDAEARKFAGLYPQFSSREAIQRVQAQSVSESAKERRKSAKQVDEAGWLLGVGMTVSVVPGAAGSVAAVLAGDPETVARGAAECSREIWERPAERQGDLVIAALSGDDREQTWENLARALTAAAPVVLPGGAIAICSELAEPPSGPLNRLRDVVDFGEVQAELAEDDATEARPAMALAQALDLGPVYLRSRLPADVVESLGMTPIEGDDELSRLAAGREHCVVIQDAQRVMPRLVIREEL